MHQNCCQNRPRMQEMMPRFSKFSGGACPRTPLAYSRALLGRFTRKRVKINKFQKNFGPPNISNLPTPMNIWKYVTYTIVYNPETSWKSTNSDFFTSVLCLFSVISHSHSWCTVEIFWSDHVTFSSRHKWCCRHVMMVNIVLDWMLFNIYNCL